VWHPMVVSFPATRIPPRRATIVPRPPASVRERHAGCYVRCTMRVRLTRKFAAQIDGVDLDGYEVGDTLDLPPAEARLLLLEEWAVPERRASMHPRHDTERIARAS
jgi:hypothetical protein